MGATRQRPSFRFSASSSSSIAFSARAACASRSRSAFFARRASDQRRHALGGGSSLDPDSADPDSADPDAADPDTLGFDLLRPALVPGAARCEGFTFQARVHADQHRPAHP